ncbi:MAG TPA: DUF5700 domain-containing putative Zn-dependent protease [Terriglobales bacterium]|nr:DUF5700 domain-containing putative Zn-dependent protease [Terriglobales bacterium]
MRSLSATLAWILIWCLPQAAAASEQKSAASRLDVRMVTDEPEAVLAILAKRKAGQPVTEADWQRLFATEGYVRLKRRERAMQRPFEDEDFRTFVMSDALLAKAAALEETLGRWKQADLHSAAQRAFAYLPPTATIRAKIYPSIKPRGNSFVFEVTTDPAIFLYLDPAITSEEFENTVAHELHHIGFGTGCGSKEEVGTGDPARAQLLRWTSAFGEGFATLAAMNSPDGHPRPSNRPEQRAEWDKEIARFGENQKELDTFFLKIVEGKLAEEETTKQAFGYFGLLGPWYTVGWKMAVTIEKAYGREKMIESFCDPRQLFASYNQAVDKTNAALPKWSEKLVEVATGSRTPTGAK